MSKKNIFSNKVHQIFFSHIPAVLKFSPITAKNINNDPEKTKKHFRSLLVGPFWLYSQQQLKTNPIVLSQTANEPRSPILLNNRELSK
jgi:hypothetical protein